MWTYMNQPVTDETVEGYEAFVYLITNLANGRRYIGKKILLRKVTRKPLKGQTRKRHSKVKSDWETYYGSNKDLQADVDSLGENQFTREILRLCKTRGEANYWEAALQFERGVLYDPEGWYNDHIWVRVHRTHLGHGKKRTR